MIGSNRVIRHFFRAKSPGSVLAMLVALLVASFLTQSANASISLNEVVFKEGTPKQGQSLAESIDSSDADQMLLLAQNADLLQKTPTIGARVYGYADKHECKSDDECTAISLKRAQLVAEWLLCAGVPAAQIAEPESGGTKWPASVGDSELDRRRNRRVDLPFFLIEDPSVRRIGVHPSECASQGPTRNGVAAEESPPLGDARFYCEPELHSIGFKTGEPKVGHPLETSVSDLEGAINSLRHNVSLVRTVAGSRFSVIGSTDNVECLGHVCHLLALR